MPAGVSWGRYLSFQVSALFTTFLGAQFIHAIYRPLADLPDIIEKAKTEKKLGEGEESQCSGHANPRTTMQEKEVAQRAEAEKGAVEGKEVKPG